MNMRAAVMRGMRAGIAGEKVTSRVRTRRRKSRGSLTERILRALQSGKAQTTREIARKAGTTVAIASAVLNRLRKQGLVLKRAPWIRSRGRGRPAA